MSSAGKRPTQIDVGALRSIDPLGKDGMLRQAAGGTIRENNVSDSQSKLEDIGLSESAVVRKSGQAQLW
jgi:hypothetical protein